LYAVLLVVPDALPYIGFSAFLSTIHIESKERKDVLLRLSPGWAKHAWNRLFAPWKPLHYFADSLVTP
jgi:hypothetical protein